MGRCDSASRDRPASGAPHLRVEAPLDPLIQSTGSAGDKNRAEERMKERRPRKMRECCGRADTKSRGSGEGEQKIYFGFCQSPIIGQDASLRASARHNNNIEGAENRVGCHFCQTSAGAARLGRGAVRAPTNVRMEYSAIGQT